MESFENKIFNYLKRKPKGNVFFADDFIRFSTPKNINIGLERLHDSGKMARVAIREHILESFEKGCGYFWRLHANSITIDPEYNIFGGWNGWSMLLSF